MTVASGSDTTWPRRAGSSPGSAGRSPTTIDRSSPSNRGSTYGQPAQRGCVAPVQVVDHQQQGPAGGDVRRQPVEPVQHPQRRVRRQLRRELGGLEERNRELCRAGEQLCSLLLRELDEKRLEELSHDTEREGAFELGAARAEHLHSRGLPTQPRLQDQRGLADSGRALDRQQAAAAGSAADQRLDGRQLGVTLEQAWLRREALVDLSAARLLSSFTIRTSQKV